MDKRTEEFAAEAEKIGEAIRYACSQSFGVLDSAFLCQQVNVLEPRPPVCVNEAATVREVVDTLRSHKTGCVLVTSAAGKLVGIFSERDVLLKLMDAYPAHASREIREVMTPDPVAQPSDITIAFALNLMSQGGFRHLPLVNAENVPTGLICVKDVVDYIVKTLVEDLLKFDLPEHQ